MGVYVRRTGHIFASSDLEFLRDGRRGANTVFNTDPEIYTKKKTQVPVIN